MEKMADFTGILLKNLGQISPEYEKKPISRKFSRERRKKLVLRYFHERF